ncbi:MAG: hypothetical protein ACOYWZ_15150 [Bacillota bacterium]
MKKAALSLLMIFLVICLLTACGGKKDHVGKYVNDSSYILLNSDGTFVADNFVKLTGSYKVQGEEVEFNVKTMNDQKISNIAKGTLKGDQLKGPDQMTYKKVSKD